MNTSALLEQARVGFATVKIADEYKIKALKHLEQWLTDSQFAEYRPQLEHMIEAGHWDYLVDCFYQIMPFGTGGRRGEVGIGPNRINPWTIQSSAQGHAQYLKKKYGDAVGSRGVVMAHDVREFFGNAFFSTNIPNPLMGLDGKRLVAAAAEVYAANGVKCFVFDGFRTTPELSFAVRYLKALAGDVFSASHNPPDHNGKKVYDETGGQLIPPDDEALVEEVTQRVTNIRSLPYADAMSQGWIEVLGPEVDDAYIAAGAALSLSSARELKIAYTPMHGCGSTSVLKVLEKLGFTVQVDPETANASGKFEHVTFQNPNPEVEQSFTIPLKFAESIQADVLLNSDPDADRMGVMIRHQGTFVFVNGNEIGSMLARYVIEKKAPALSGEGIVIKTVVTTNLITKIAEANKVQVIGDLLVGFKFIGNVMNRLEREGKIEHFLFGSEESHGYIAGNHLRDKDAVVAAVWLCELAAELKMSGKTLVDYLNETYARYGYFRNYLTEIRLPGAEGMTQIQAIQKGLREKTPSAFGRFQVAKLDDWMERKPIVSETDKAAKSGLGFEFVPVEGTSTIRVTVRPSGTEPKIKMYYEIGAVPCTQDELPKVRESIERMREELERAFMKECYRLIGVDFPDRGFLLFWQLPLKEKLHYFEIEEALVGLRSIPDGEERKKQFLELVAFLGSDPKLKMNGAFRAKYGEDVDRYLNITL